jgi:hypothetical protein
MKTVSILLAAVLLFASRFDSVALPPCNGVERWSVKVVTDSAASRINYTPKQARISDFVKLRPQYSGMEPRADVERQTYEVTCRIAGYKREADGDIHIVMMDPNDNSVTMIGEIPDPDCPNVSNSPLVSAFRSARAQIASFAVEHDDGSGLHKVARGLYKLVGIGFMDRIEGQLGVAPNGIELHPVISVTRIE